MNLDRFYYELLNLVPYTKEPESPFKTRLENCLRDYEVLVNQLEFNGNAVSNETKRKISAICRKIKEMVKVSMKGEPSTAFRIMSNMLTGYQRTPPKIELGKLVISIGAGTSFYRMRKMDSIYGIEREELFHIPVLKRGMVKSHRYSSPGYPCLYLGKSIYACWEEMRRPPMFQCAVSRFENSAVLNFIDLTIPSKENMADDFYLKLMPLVIACMIKVSDDDATYKPEYIVPQLLIEWVLKYRENEKYVRERPIHGVAYHSTQLNEEFGFSMEKFVNYAIPAFKVDSNKKYCPTLCGSFSLTKPTTNEIEKLKGDYPMHVWEEVADHDEQLAINYDCSDFGTFESRINDVHRFPLGNVE